MITRIRFDAGELQRFGLKTPELVNLGPLVVLAGPNGGGKTRYLSLVEAEVNRVDAARRELGSMSRLRDEAAKSGAEFRVLQSDAARVERIERYAAAIDDTIESGWLHATTIRYLPHTVPGDPKNLSPDAFDRRLADIGGGAYSAVAEGMHVYLEATARALWNGKHPGGQADPAVTRDYEMACQFNAMVQELLGTTIEPQLSNSRVIARLFGQPFQPALLSVGQHVLLCWAILLLRQAGHYKRCIVLIDEPEVYLHPDACARAIESLQKLIGGDGQIWIATHSLPLIAWAGADSLHFVQDGVVSFAGTTPSRVWQTLLGNDTARERLLAFLDGDAAAAAVRFASECLLPPGVASARSDDPQTSQFVPVVEQRLRTAEAVRVLEIGAGRGRLAAAVAELLRAQPELHAKQLTYIAYEDPRFVEADHRAACQDHLAALRGLGVDARYSTSLAEHRALPDERIDLVVLANTLHEIPVEDWLGLFEDIRAACAPDARLLVVEDQEPRVGEMPHPRGFLILEEREWTALVGQQVRANVHEHHGRRLTAFEIPVARLAYAKDNLGLALDLVAKRAVEEIRALRGGRGGNGHRAGRRHAFLAMLHLNATLAQQIYPPR